MVTIREIRYIRSSACVLLDTGEKVLIRMDDLPASGFKEGVTYDRNQFFLKIRILQYPHALNCAVAMLARRPCSKSEIHTRLIRRQFTEDTADLVLYKLEKEKLIDDKAFSEQWVRFRSSHGYGPAFIRYELKMKGISDDLISLSVDSMNEEQKMENALKLAGKAWNRIKPDEDQWKAKRKVMLFLVRKGYDWDTVKSACDKAADDN